MRILVAGIILLLVAYLLPLAVAVPAGIETILLILGWIGVIVGAILVLLGWGPWTGVEGRTRWRRW